MTTLPHTWTAADLTAYRYNMRVAALEWKRWRLSQWYSNKARAAGSLRDAIKWRRAAAVAAELVRQDSQP